MSLGQMKVFDEYYMPAAMETLAQRVELFNEASGGAILLTTEGFTGDFFQRSFWKGINGGTRVNRYAENTEVTATDLAQEQENSVKIAGRVGPLRYEPSQMTWLQKPTGEAIALVSSELANVFMSDQLNTALAAAVGAFGKTNATKLDVSATDTISQTAFNNTHALFGDRSMNLITTVIDGKAWHELVNLNLKGDYTPLYTYGTIRVLDILGKRVVVTDSPALRGGGKVNALHLSNAGIVVSDGGDVISNIDTVNGKERIETTLQIDYTFGLRMRGWSWNTAHKSPTDVQLASGANWTMVASDVKHTAGVLTVCSATPVEPPVGG